MRKQSKIAAAAAAVLGDVTSGTARIADESLSPVTKVDKHAQTARMSDEAAGIALASLIIAEAKGQDRGVWLTYVARMIPMVPVARAALLKALRAHRDDVKAQGAAHGMAKTAQAASVWLSNMVSIASALNAGMVIPCKTNPDGTFAHNRAGDMVPEWGIAHCIAQARLFRQAQAAEALQAEAASIAAAVPGITAEQARAIAEHQQAAKRGRKAKGFDAVVLDLADKRQPTEAEIRATIAALSARLPK